MIREDMVNRLKRLDEDAALLYDDDKRFNMVIVGGGALILLETITRATHDIDALYVPRELMNLITKYDINCNVQTYINNFPYNYEDRLHKLPLNGQKIDFYTTSLEDIVIAKLYSFRDTDRQDIIDENVVNAVDWNTLERLALSEDEAKASALNDRTYHLFLENYNEYIRRCKPCEN